MTFKHPASSILWNYLGFVDRIYGMYSDACSGLEIFGSKIEGSTKPDQRGGNFFVGSGDPSKPDATYKHVAKISEVIARNQKDGENQKLLSQSCIVFIYSLWDTEVRPNYAKKIEVDQKEVASDLFGDLRHYRHAIVHNNGILESETRTLKFIEIGSIVELTRSQTEQLLAMLFDDVSTINRKFTGEAFDLKFERRLNPEPQAESSSKGEEN